MSRKHKSQKQSSPVSQPRESASLTPRESLERTSSKKAKVSNLSATLSVVPSVDQAVTPVFLPLPPTHHESVHSSTRNTSYFMPLSEAGLYGLPMKFLPPLSSNNLSNPQTLPPISMILSSISSSSSPNYATESRSQTRATSMSYQLKSSGSDSSPTRTATSSSSSSVFEEDSMTSFSSSNSSLTNLTSTNRSNAPETIHRKSLIDVTLPSTTLEDPPIPRRPGSASATDDDQIEDAELPSLPLLEASEESAVGRLSSQGEEELANGFAELDRIMRKIKLSTGLNMNQIMKRWQPPGTRDLNFWNIYQKYFQAKTQEELHRLQEKDRPADGAKANVKTIRAAYKAFQQDEPNHESILELFWRIHEIEASNTTLNSRCRDFTRYIKVMKRLAECASTVNGFETVFCAVGSVVHQDQSLSATFCSRMVPEFFPDRLNLSDNDFEGHLKAHVYDRVSRMALACGADDTVAPEPPVSDQPPLALGDSNTTVKVKGENRRLLTVLKDRFMNLLGPCKISQLRQSHFPFADIPKILAQNGWIMENWPENVPFPCDLKKGQGIACLRARFRQPLLRAFDDRHYPLKVTKKYSEAVPPSEPVIIGLPPPPESEHTHGRRRFLDANQTADRKGPARRISVAGTRYHQGSGEPVTKRTKPSDGDGVDGMRCRKRRKGER